MSDQDITLQGGHGNIVVRRWDSPDPQRIVVLAHGVFEHSGRYEHVAGALTTAGSVVYAPDHHGHGRSDGEKGPVEDIEAMSDDLRLVVDLAESEHPGLPIALLGHSLGGIIVTRYVQKGDARIAAVAMTGPVIGGNPGFSALLGMDPIPEVPLDPAALSRDPSVGQAYLDDPLVYRGPLQRTALQSLEDVVAAIGSGPGYGELPVLWLHGEGDQLAPIESTRPVIERLGGETLIARSYPGAQHEILNETNQDEVIAEVVAFFDAQVPAASTA